MTATERADLTAALKQAARDAGFDLVGVAAADRLERDGAALEAWLRRDYQASMAWMARDPARRADPRRLLPGCRSVVALAMNYWPGASREASAPAAQVARYARGRDYHKVMGRKLKRLAAWLAERSGRPALSFVDTGPVLERAWAEQAGIGWIGKNANLLSRDWGSWLLLGEILSVQELEPDPGPHADHCGSCNACIEACPTAAIVSDGVVDANRCISFWTIERRGPIPDERRELENWIFGCDVCQDVCPWNVRFARPVPAQRFGRREELEALDPAEILALDESAFRRRYSGTALMRAKWEGMRRNACLLLGARGDRRGLEPLARALGDADPVIRGHAAWAVGRIGGERAAGLLRAAARRETAAEVLHEIRHALEG